MLLQELRGVVGGRHRQELREGRIVCPRLGTPISAPSNLRECEDCGAQVSVAVGACTALVDAGRLAPQCPRCWRASGKTLAMHPDIETELTSRGLLESGWQRLGELNEELD
jgi:hypothetical protein